MLKGDNLIFAGGVVRRKKLVKNSYIMKLQLTNIKEGEWDWFFKRQQAILIGFLVAGFLLLITLVIVAIFLNKK